MDYDAHDLEDGALAIMQSVDLLGLAKEDHVDVFEGYADAGDSRGGVKAQDLGPEMERIGVLSSNYVVANCIFHDMSKVIETADTFCWKLCFLITSMISLLKKKDGIQTVKEYFKLTMAHLLEYDECHQEMADLFLDVYRSKIQPLAAGDDGKSNDEECEDAIIEFVSDCNKWGTVDNT